ncbi:MAG TPA: biotin--[acetyl-CoA-carboxylase] ligase [Arenimonas sp.]|nr:biotin--[acetyl-CoA-carboxylase] ligase [Arenimonas sp.]
MDNTVLLKALLTGPKSGVELAQLLGISRAAIWKRVEVLRQQGLEIEASEAHGYRLMQPMTLLDESLIIEVLSPELRSQINTLNICFETDSTQIQAYNHPVSENGIDVWLAEYQRAGQGRRGKVWQSPPMSNIYCSINRRFNCSMAELSGFSLAVAVLIADALQSMHVEGLSLKWPNDIWLNGKKCAGLLIQLRGESSGPCDVTLGFGLNVSMSKQSGRHIDQAWTALNLESDINMDRNIIIGNILKSLLQGFQLYEQHGFSAFVERWRSYDGLCGKPISLALGTQVITGVAQGIDSDGALLVQHNSSLSRYHSGEVSVRLVHE